MKQYTFLQESIVPLAVATGITFGTWIANKHIRAARVMAKYPTPLSLKEKLLTSNNALIRSVAEELSEDMTPQQYREWVMTKTSPKMGIGKALIMFLLQPFSTVFQIGKAAVHASESPDTILDRSERTGRMIVNH